MFGRSFTVARIMGIAIEVNPSWLIILGLVGVSLSETVFPDQYGGWHTATYWVMGFATAILFFVTILVHELAHAVVAIRRGLKVPRITLFIFGGVSHLESQPRSAREEFYIAAIGPATSLVLAIAFGLVAAAAYHRQEQLFAMAFWLSLINTTLAIFNILPGFPLDGGRVFRSIAWGRTHSFKRATTIAANVGIGFGYLLMLLGLVLLLLGDVLGGIWMAFIGWFLAGAARQEGEGMRLESVLSPLVARDLMHGDFATIEPGRSVEQLVDEFMVGRGQRAVMVANGERVLGIVTISDTARVPRTEWSNTPVQRIMTPREEIVTVPATQPALDVLALISERRFHQVPVLEEGRMIGLITRRELLDRVQVAERLGAGQEPRGGDASLPRSG